MFTFKMGSSPQLFTPVHIISNFLSSLAFKRSSFDGSFSCSFQWMEADAQKKHKSIEMYVKSNALCSQRIENLTVLEWRGWAK